MVFNWGWGYVVRGIVFSTSSGFSSGLLFSVGGFLALDFHCAWLGAFGVSTGEKKYFNKCERM